MFKLTDRGEDEAQKVTASPRLETKVVTFMYMTGKAVELEEIQDEVRLSDEKTVQLLKRMINEGLVEEV